MPLSNEILTQSLALPPADRAALAHHLIQSLNPSDSHGDEAEWEKEFQARLDAVETGNFEAHDATAVIADIRKSLQKRRQS